MFESKNVSSRVKEIGMILIKPINCSGGPLYNVYLHDKKKVVLFYTGINLMRREVDEILEICRDEGILKHRFTTIPIKGIGCDNLACVMYTCLSVSMHQFSATINGVDGSFYVDYGKWTLNN